MHSALCLGPYCNVYRLPDIMIAEEANLSPSVRKSIDDLLDGIKKNVSYLDCLYDELYGSINSDQWGGVMSKQQADYLRRKYIFGSGNGNRED